MRTAFILFVIISLNLSLQAQVRFDANFESGNLQSVTTTDSVTYTVKTKEDIGGRWFYFRMAGVKNRFVRVKISNSDVTRAMYSYDNINYSRFTAAESPAVNQFEKTYLSDTVYAAYYTPYNFSYLNKRISEWRTNPAFSLDTIGYTKRNLPLYEMTITDRSVPDSVKEHIWIHARTHPGETPSSWHFDGIIKKLLGGEEPVKYYLQKLVFHCIPFTNPDGVYYGRSRTNYDSVDVESNWNKADSLTSREVLLLKQRMKLINQNKVIKVFLNLHSQASQFCTFWIHTAASTSASFYKREMQFGQINISDNPYFRLPDFSYSTLSMTFPEGFQWKTWGDKTMALTYETPYDFYSTALVVDSTSLAYLGERTVYSLAEYLELQHPKRMVVDNAQITASWTKDTVSNDYFGSNYLYTSTAAHAGPAVYTSGTIQAGRYDIYGWWPANAAYCDAAKITMKAGASTAERIVDERTNGGKWNQLTSLSLSGQGEIVISVSDSGNGKIVADAFRIVYVGLPAGTGKEYTAAGFELYQNYPNPFNPSTTIRFSLSEPADVKLQVFNSLGQLIATLREGYAGRGQYESVFDGGRYASGVYYARLSSGKNIITRPMLLLK